MKRCTVVLPVAAIEPSLPFWQALGFERTATVPHEGAIGFVIFERGSVQVMLQSIPSIEVDHAPTAAALTGGPTLLFVEVSSLDEVRGPLEGAPVVMAERTTFYGTREIGVRTPGGHQVTFAEFLAPETPS